MVSRPDPRLPDMLDNGRLGTDEFASHRPNSVDEVSIPVDRIEPVPQIGINPAMKKQIQAAYRFLNIIVIMFG